MEPAGQKYPGWHGRLSPPEQKYPCGHGDTLYYAMVIAPDEAKLQSNPGLHGKH
jgi:hypothetical protein